MKKVMFALLLVTTTAQAEPVDYTIDASHSRVGFKVSHLAISTVQGHFSDFEGKITYDDKDIKNCKSTVSIKVPSISTANEKRDQHLRSPDFFNADKHPQIKFVSNEFQKVGDKKFKLTGNLTILDVTKPVQLDVDLTGSVVDMYGRERIAFKGITKINRKDFGLTWSKTLDSGALVVGDEVEIAIEAEGVKNS